MDESTMLQTSSILLLLTAGGGVLMAWRRLAQKANPPDWLAMAHGLLAAAALTLLIYAAAVDGVPSSALFGLILLLAAAAGGVILNLVYHLAGKLLPQWLVHVHITLAAAGTVLVAWGAWAS
jgi:hypothetical protein